MAPRDLFAENGIQPVSSGNVPRDLFAENGIVPTALGAMQNPTAQNMSNYVNTFGQTTPFQQAVQNQLHHGALEAEKHISQPIDALFGTNFAAGVQPKINALSQDPQMQQQMQEHPFQTRAGEAVGSALPQVATSMAMPEAGVLKRLLSQGAAGGLTSDNFLGGTALGAAGEGIASLLGIPGSKILEKMMTSNLPGKAKDMWNAVLPFHPMNNESALQKAAANENIAKQNESALHENVKQMASVADQNPNFDISNEKYVDALLKKKAQLEEDMQHSPTQELKDSLALVNHWIDAPHYDLAGMIEHGKNLNQEWRRTVTPGVDVEHSTVKYAIKSLKDALNDNFEKNGLQKTLGKAYQNANDATKYRNDVYHSVADKNGDMASSGFYDWQKNAVPGNFINQYLPTSAAHGTDNMERLAEMLGSKDQANQLIKQNLFGNAANEKQALSIFNNMSEAQKRYLFKPGQYNHIQSLNKALSKSDRLYTPPAQAFESPETSFGKTLKGLLKSGISASPNVIAQQPL